MEANLWNCKPAKGAWGLLPVDCLLTFYKKERKNVVRDKEKKQQNAWCRTFEERIKNGANKKITASILGGKNAEVKIYQ